MVFSEKFFKRNNFLTFSVFDCDWRIPKETEINLNLFKGYFSLNIFIDKKMLTSSRDRGMWEATTRQRNMGRQKANNGVQTNVCGMGQTESHRETWDAGSKTVRGSRR